MIFRQLFDGESSTYTYLLASRLGGEALIIDPVLEKVDRYIQLLEDLDLRLIKAVDTQSMRTTSPVLVRCGTRRAVLRSWENRAVWMWCPCGSARATRLMSKAWPSM